MEAIYQRDSDQDGLTDAQELALGTNPLSADSDGDGRSDLVEVEEGTNPLEKDLQDIDQTSITEPSSVFMEMKQKISDMMESHYKEFIQALISIETGIENQQDLEDLYTYYMRKWNKVLEENRSLEKHYSLKLAEMINNPLWEFDSHEMCQVLDNIIIAEDG